MARRMRVRDESKDHLDVVAGEYAQLKHTEKETEAQRKDVGHRLLSMMDDLGVIKHRVDFDEDTVATISIKERDNSRIDPDRLKHALGAKAFNKLTTPVLDESKVEAAIQLGEVDANVVSSCMEENKTSYLEARFQKKRRKAS